MLPLLDVTAGSRRTKGFGMKSIALAVAPLAALGAACTKAGQSSSGRAKAAPVAVGGLTDGLTKAAMVETGLTNFTGGVSK